MLDTLKSMHSSDPTACLTEMLKVWLKSVQPVSTWKALRDALRAGPVGESELAQEGSQLL